MKEKDVASVRVWAPHVQRMTLSWRGQFLPMEGPSKRGWWTLEVDDAVRGDECAFLLDDNETPYHDPRSRRQPDGVMIAKNQSDSRTLSSLIP